MKYIETNHKYKEGIKLDNYKGVWSLVCCREGNEGQLYPQWAFPQDKDRKPRPKAIPIKVVLGSSKADAIINLKKLLFQLEGGTAPAELPEDVKDIPF